MSSENRKIPAERDVTQIVKLVFNEKVLSIERFPTGNCHFVFDAFTESKKNVVVRIAKPENRHFLEGAVFWYRLLKPKGVPIPEMLAFDLTAEFPFVILERLPGKDLNQVYPQLSKHEKKVLASRIAEIQRQVGTLPPAEGFGYLESYQTNGFSRTWTAVLQKSLERSRTRIIRNAIFEIESVARVEEKLHKYENYFSNIAPLGFLDDITTKNVIINEGKLSGIVDTDFVCFGDNLLTVALTRMSLLLSGYELDYIEFWCAEMNLSDERRKILDLYTALFAVDFMSEFGQVFNKEEPLAVDNKQFLRLNLILENLLSSI